MTLLVAGIDGGQTSTTAVIGDEQGRIVGRGVAGPADEVGTGTESTRLHDALRDALEAARVAAGVEPNAQFAAIVAGVSGYEGRVFGKAPVLPATRFLLMHDAPVAHAGALAGRPGVVVIAGTGSAVYATDGNRGHTTGGWGYLFGDEGSAFWFSREALATLMRSEDAGDPRDRDEIAAACDFFGRPSLRRVARDFYGGLIDRHRVAAFAQKAVAAERFASVAERGADALADLACGAIAWGAAQTVACVGGMFSDRRFFERVGDAVRARMPAVRVVEPAYDPSAGALLLAYREAGLPSMLPR